MKYIVTLFVLFVVTLYFFFKFENISSIRGETQPFVIMEKNHNQSMKCHVKNLIHMYWSESEHSKTMNRKVITSVRSAVRTQWCAHIMLWTNAKSVLWLTQQIQHILRNLSSCSSKSTIQVLSTEYLVQYIRNNEYTELESCIPALSEVSNDSHHVSFSDLLRFIALYVYGGIYVDADTIFLKDMSTFHGLSFAFKWDVDVDYYNTAIMGLKIHDSLVTQIITKTGHCTASSFYPTRIHEYLTCHDNVCEELIMMPTVLFNGAQSARRWQEMLIWNGNHAFFDKPRLWNLDHFFPGSYTYHWHNQWDVEIHSESWFAAIEKINSVC